MVSVLPLPSAVFWLRAKIVEGEVEVLNGGGGEGGGLVFPPFVPGLASSLSSILDVDDGQPLQDNKFTPTGFVKPLLPLVLL